MARAPDSFIPTVAPESAPANDYLRVDASPGAFGAGVGGALARAGQEVVGAGRDAADIAINRQQRFNQLATDDGFNNFQESVRKITHGDSSDPTQKGYYQMLGREALDARAPREKAVEAARMQIRGGLQNDAQRVQFDQMSRRYTTLTLEGMGRHADTQSKVWGATVQKSVEQTQLKEISDNWNNNDAFNNGLEHGRGGTVRHLQEIYGLNVDPVVVQAELNRFTSEAVKARVEGWAATDPAGAAAWLKDGVLPEPGTRKPVPVREAVNPQVYAQLQQHLEAKGNQAAGNSAAVRAYAGSGSALGSAITTATAAVPGSNADTLMRTARLENSDAEPNKVSQTGARGRFQFIPSTAAQYGLSDPDNLDQSANAAARLQVDNRKALATLLGRPATEPEVYLAHQQGAGGAAMLIQNPNMPATQARALAKDGNGSAVTVNGGRAGQTASDFVNMWRDKFNAAGPPAGATNDAPDHTTDRAQGFANLVKDHNEGRLSDSAFEIAVSKLSQLQAIDAKIKADAAEQAFNDYIPKALKAPALFDMAGMLGDSRLTGMQKNTIHGIVTRALKGDIDKPTEISQAKRTEILDGIRDGKITTLDPLREAVAHGGLNVADYNFAKSVFDQSQTDNGKSLNEQVKFLQQTMKGSLETGFRPGTKSFTADADFARWKWWADNKIAEAQKAGTIGKLLDPNSSDYIGPRPEIVQQFRTPMDEGMKIHFGNIGMDVTPAAKLPMAATEGMLDTFDKVKEAVRNGTISRAEGIAEATKRGWIKPDTSPPPGSPANPATLGIQVPTNR